MADITWTNVTCFFAELDSVTAEHREVILDYVNGVIVDDQFDGADGPTTKLAKIYLAAHHGAMIVAGRLSSGPVKRDRAGGLEREYAASDAQSTSSLQSTGAGLLYLDLIRSNAKTALGLLL